MADRVDIDIILNTDVSKMDNSQISKFTGAVSKYIKSLNDLDLSQEIGSLETFSTAIQNTTKALQNDQNTIAQYQAQLKSLGQSVQSNRRLFAKYDSTTEVQKVLHYSQNKLKKEQAGLNKAFEKGDDAGVDRVFQIRGPGLQHFRANSCLCSENRTADRHFFLYLSGAVLCDRCVPG